jgi:hypothetical protein
MPYGYGSQGPAGGASSGGNYGGTKNTNQNYGGDNNRENYRNTTAAKASAKKAATNSKANKIKNDATSFDNYTYTAPKFVGSILAKALDVTGIAKKGFETNKAYYEKNVIGKNNFTKSIDSYKSYMSKRGSGEIDAMGRWWKYSTRNYKKYWWKHNSNYCTNNSRSITIRSR